MKKVSIILLYFLLLINTFCQQATNDYMKGVAKMMMGQNDSSVYYLTSAIASDPSNVNYYMNRGKAFFKLNDYNKAIEDFFKADKLKADIADLWIAKAYSMLGKEDEAFSYLEKHLKSAYRSPEKEIKSDDAFNGIQNSDAWFLLWQNDWYSPEEQLNDEIDFFITKEQYSEALILIDDQINSSKNKEILYQYRARILSKQGNYKAATMDWSQVIDLDKNNIENYKERGHSNLKAEKYKEAIDDFTKVIRFDPSEFQFYIQRAEAFSKIKDYNSAIKDMETYLTFFPKDYDAIRLCGEYYFENNGYLGALRYFNMNLSLDATKPEYFKLRGKTYYKTRMYKLAFDDLSMSLDLYPKDGEAYYYLGLVKFNSGNEQGACSDWKKAVELGEVRAVELILDNCK